MVPKINSGNGWPEYNVGYTIRIRRAGRMKEDYRKHDGRL